MEGRPNAHDYDVGSLPDLLPVYYKRLFPYGPYYRWLSYGEVPKSMFTNREFSFTLKDDVYIRYLSFTDQLDLEKEMQKMCPYKIDIGAVFSHRPKDHKTVQSGAFQPQEKELVFDIDITDYDDVRSCCSGANICERCWPLMTLAVKILKRALTEDFGFKHILWVYSGRRGIHCWVCDEEARKLPQTGRTAIAEYLNVVKGGEHQLRKVRLDTHFIHPSIQEALKILEKHFEEYACKQQDFLSDEQKWKKVLALIPSEELRNKITVDMDRKPDSTSRWARLKKFIKMSLSSGNFRDSQRVVEEIMLQYCYPRLDINVSIGVNHLLKSPFCVHPKTGRVCVPMDPDDIDSFSPFAVPTITQLLEELNEIEMSGNTGQRQKVNKCTSLGPSLEVFGCFLKKLETSIQGQPQEEIDRKMEF